MSPRRKYGYITAPRRNYQKSLIKEKYFELSCLRMIQKKVTHPRSQRGEENGLREVSFHIYPAVKADNQ